MISQALRPYSAVRTKVGPETNKSPSGLCGSWQISIIGRTFTQVTIVDQGLLDQGITLMLVGMGTVFVFLTTLVAAMNVLSIAVRKLRSEPAGAGATDEEVAAIAAAITAHRKK
jgi:sodium pump decarboxylase gamma subunit